MNTITRREAFRITLGAGAAALGIPALVSARPARARTRVARIAHLTDLHIQPERRAAEGVAACLRHVRALPDPPELIVTGGDLIMDGFEQDEARTKLQWDLFRKVMADEAGLPVEHCLGNHDIWGWNKGKSGTNGDEAMWGKKWALDQLGLARPYRSFDRFGWHMIVLDSVYPNGTGYIAHLDEEQMDWLRADLAGTARTTPVLVVSHIPILSVTGVTGSPKKDATVREVSSSVLHDDSQQIRGLFAAHGNVRLAVSGHMHRIDRVDFNGTTYLCNGAVSGNWWKGAHYECHEGYAVLDLYDDGSFGHEYVRFGWKAS